MKLCSKLSVPRSCQAGESSQAFAGASDAVGSNEEEAALVDAHELWFSALPADTKHWGKGHLATGRVEEKVN